MKKKIQDWLRKQLGCPTCAARAAQPRFVATTFPAVASAAWPAGNGQSMTYTYIQRGDA